MNSSLLEGLKILDLTQRLPGPFATKILLDLGAEVTKVSPKGKSDAFLNSDESSHIFNIWFKNINGKKILKEIDFSTELQNLIDLSDIIIAPINFKIQNYNINKKCILLTGGGTGPNQAMHDLNALAQSDTFKFFTHSSNSSQIDPPYLPFAGLSYAQQMATECLALYIKFLKTNIAEVKSVYLDESCKNNFDLFFDKSLLNNKRLKFLHNGLYPCYNIYRTKDAKYVALAAVEEKFWNKFNEIFNLTLKKEDRFDTSGNVIKLLINTFSRLTLDEISQAVSNNDICLTCIE